MNNREHAMAILNYQSYDRMPVVHFGFWNETLEKWAEEGHITAEQARKWGDGNAADFEVGNKLGFDFNWYRVFGVYTNLLPPFERKVLEVMPDGMRKEVNGDGVVILQKDDATGIPTEIDHLFKGRKEWDELFKPRMLPDEKRIFRPEPVIGDLQRGDQAADAPRARFRDHINEIVDEVQRTDRDRPIGLMCGSLYGRIRDIVGMVNLSYLQADDPDLFDEMIGTFADLCYWATEKALETYGDTWDFGHFWEDICFRSGPLVSPRVLQAESRPAISAHHRSAARPRDQHRLAGLRRQDRRADPHLVRERRQHHVPDRGRHLECQHRAVAGEIRAGTSRRRRHGQEGVRLRLCGDRCRSRAPEAVDRPGRLHPLPRSSDCAGRQMGERAVLLRANAQDVRRVICRGDPLRSPDGAGARPCPYKMGEL